MFAVVSAARPPDAAAQRRAHPPVGVRTAVVVGPAYYGYYDPFFWPYYGWYGGWYPYGFDPRYDQSGYFHDHQTGSARLQVTPKQTEVYVDGYLAGTVDEFDGFLQRLEVPSGEHEVTLYLDGYQTIHQRVLFRRGATLRISHTMQPLPAGAARDPRPQPDPNAEPLGRDAAPRPAPSVRDREVPAGFGTLAIRIQPRDAVVFVDGQEWNAPEGQEPLVIELADGSHAVEVRKQGFTSYRTEVRVRSGETVALNVSLSR